MTCKHLWLNWSMSKSSTQYCVVCGKDRSLQSKTHRDMCRSCYRKSKRIKLPPRTIMCPVCGIEFTTNIFNKRCCSKQCTKALWYINNRDSCKEYGQEYYQRIRKHRENRSDRVIYQNSVHRKIADNLRKRLSSAVSRGYRAGSAVRDLGCTIEEFKRYLESQFYNRADGTPMSWDNYGRDGWHIDHIKPLAKFDIADVEDCKIACHYTNLQPLWAEDNLKKSSAIWPKRK